MDITLIKTFLEVAASGSFVAASDRLFVTQSAVSLRVQRLEDSLGHPLFTRSKAGAILTPAGEQFHYYALSLIKIWEEARQQIAIPEGFSRTISIGAQYALWPRLGFRWIDAMRTAMPELSIRTAMGMTDDMTRNLIEGTVDAALLYMPHLRPGLIIEPLLDDELILVSSFPVACAELRDEYVFVNWGPEFIHAHAIALPHLTNAGRTMSLGALTAEYIVNRHAASYLPARAVKRYLESEKLQIVADAPRFSYPAWVVWRDDLDDDIADIARTTLKQVAEHAEEEQEILVHGLEEMDAFQTGPARPITNE